MYSHFSQTDWVTPFGLIFLLATFTAWWFTRRNAISIGIDGSHIDLILPIAMVTGVIGGTFVAMYTPMDHELAGNAMNHGIRLRLFGILGTGAIAVFAYARLTGLSFRSLLDAFALPTIAGIAIHRTGCYLAGCCWGDLVTSEPVGALARQVQTVPWLGQFAWGVTYPPGSLPYEQHLALGLIGPDAAASLPVYPVQLYEVGLLLVLILLLGRIQWREMPRGTLTVLVVFAYAFMRFFVEFLRADGSVALGSLTVTHLQCLVLMASIVLLPRLGKPGVS